MLRPRRMIPALLAGLVLAPIGALAGGPAQAAAPSYSVTYLGPGSPVAISDTAVVVGYRTDPATGVRVPLVSRDGAAWSPLPVPSGFPGAFPTDVNDAGVIVGVASKATVDGRRAVRWTPTGGAYAVEVLPLLTGESTSYATAINDVGQIVGARAGLLGTPFGFGWVYSDASGMQGLLATYGWDAAAPVDINAGGVILDGTQTFDLARRTVSDVGLQLTPAVGGVALNDAGQIVGLQFTSGSLPTARVYRYTPGQGWQFITGTDRYTTATSINAGGDMGVTAGIAVAPGLYLQGEGLFALNDLIDPAARAAGWTTPSGAPEINDSRVVTVSGRNTSTGQSGALLLRPSGSLPPPAAPVGLSATPHPATTSEPFDSIDLSWQNGDVALTRSYELERSLAGQNGWTSIALVPPATGTTHQDTTVASATRYDYRVRAVGVGGAGPWSDVATATSPTVAPTVTMRVTRIVLSSALRRGVVTVTATVDVRTAGGAAVPGATVAATWTLPGGGTQPVTANTNSQGQAQLTTTGSRGTYTLTVTGVTKAGFSFEAAGSVLSRSITR